MYPTGRARSYVGLRVLTWSLTPHLPAAVSARSVGSSTLSSGYFVHFTGARDDRSGRPEAGLTS